MSNTAPEPGFATRAIHHGYDPQAYHGALNPPVFLTSTYGFDQVGTGSARFAGDAEGYVYSRVGNPTTAVLESRLAALEEGEAALATSSGMGALTSVFWTLLKQGDEVVADKTLYGCTFGLLEHHLPRFGVTARFIDMADPAGLRAAMGPKTRIVLAETPANPNMRMVDIAAIAAIAHAGGALLVIDNTYCTPYLQRPLTLGADIVVHSATKYLGGHGDLLAGAVVARKELVDQFRFVGVKELTGACISAFDAFLILRGLKTLALRMDRHCASAARLSADLEGHALVERVHYPGLDSHPQQALAGRQMKAMGGMLALELRGGVATGRIFMDALRLATRAVSLGDAETLVQHPASMTHSTYAPEEREKHGFTDGLIRVSVGLEDYDDIRGDIFQALDRVTR